MWPGVLETHVTHRLQRDVARRLELSRSGRPESVGYVQLQPRHLAGLVNGPENTQVGRSLEGPDGGGRKGGAPWATVQRNRLDSRSLHITQHSKELHGS